jgi:hypothetical protein
MKVFLHWLPAICLLAAGCGLDGPAPSERKREQAAGKPAEPVSSAEHSVDRKPLEKKGAHTSAEVLAEGQRPGMVREKAAPGMGEKGRGYGGDMITIPFKTYWLGKEALTLVQIKKSLEIYKGMDPQGKGPKTQAEFMEKIIKENSIKLPTLPEGQRYVYDPTTEDLLVERPGLE